MYFTLFYYTLLSCEYSGEGRRNRRKAFGDCHRMEKLLRIVERECVWFAERFRDGSLSLGVLETKHSCY
jgi:hypothetical protein